MIRAAICVTARAAFLAAVLAAPAFAGPADDPANWRKVDPENLLQLTIKRQEVLIELRPDFAPGHVEQIRKITRDGNYNLLPFHRVIDDFMAQGGEVAAVYMLSTPYPQLKAEFTFDRKPAEKKAQWFGQTANGDKLGYLDGFVVQGQPDDAALLMGTGGAKTWALHCAGVTSMARTNQPDSADTQFFLMRQSNSVLDKNYTVWGRAVAGLDVIRGIKAGPSETDGRMPPAVADKLGKAMIVADLPPAKQPQVYVMRTDGPEFAAQLASVSATDAYGACNLLPVPVVVEMPTPP